MGSSRDSVWKFLRDSFWKSSMDCYRSFSFSWNFCRNSFTKFCKDFLSNFFMTFFSRDLVDVKSDQIIFIQRFWENVLLAILISSLVHYFIVLQYFYVYFMYYLLLNNVEKFKTIEFLRLSLSVKQSISPLWEFWEIFDGFLQTLF